MNDADIEMMHLTEIARRSEAARKRGKCAHGWVQGSTCKECGKVFPSFEALLDERNELIS